MATVEKSLQLSLNEGVVEGVLEDVIGGAITRSENTRLTKVKGTVTRRPLASLVDIGITPQLPVCGGVFVGGRQSVLACFEGGANRRISDAASEGLVAPATGTVGVNSFYPYPIVDSGAVGGGYVGLAPATAFDSMGRQWFASSKIVGGTTVGVFVSVVADGREVITSRVVQTQTALQFWVGLTPYGTGMLVWYEDAVGISVRLLSVSGTGLAVSSPTAIYTPLEPSGYLQADITTDGTYAYLVTRHSSVATSIIINKITIATLLVTSSVTIPSVVANTAPPVYFSLTWFTNAAAGVTGLAIATSEGAGVTYSAVYDAATLTALWSVTGAGQYGAVSALPWVNGSNRYVVFAQAITAVTGVGTDTSGVIFTTRSMTAGTSIGQSFAYWYGLQSKGCYHTPPVNNDVYPYFPLFARWGVPGAPPTLPGAATPTIFFDTPSIEVVTPFSATVFTPVMRCGVDQVSQYSSILYNSTACVASADGKMCLAYMTDRYDQPSSASALFSSRYVVFDLQPMTQPATAVDAGNVAVIGGGMPAAWDGIEVTEYAPFHRPKIQVNGSGGSGPNLTGAIAFSAVVSWHDSFGNVRRSAPALPQTVVFAGTKAQVFVTMPLTMRQGERQESFEVSIYATVPSGAVLIAVNAQTVTRGTMGCWKYDFINAAVLGDVELYSQFALGAQPLQPECPPAIWDVRSIGGRLWAIDAENRYRLLPSLLKQDGIAFEFNSTLQITAFDQQYGKLMAVADVGGAPVAFAERGIWQIDGYGPDNAGQGGVFTDPRLISNMGCRSRESVAQVPGVGVLFQANDGRFCLLAGGFKRFETFGVYDVGVPTVHLLQNEVIYPLTTVGGWIAYNWVADAWTHWPRGSLHPSMTTLQTSTRSRTYMARTTGAGSVLEYMDSDSVDTDIFAPILIKRGWIAPEGPQADGVIRECWLQAVRVAGHGVTIRVALDFDDTGAANTFIERTWTSAAIATLAAANGGRYSIAVNCKASPVRAADVTVTTVPDSGVGEHFEPIGLTIAYGLSPGLRRQSLLDGAVQ